MPFNLSVNWRRWTEVTGFWLGMPCSAARSPHTVKCSFRGLFSTLPKKRRLEEESCSFYRQQQVTLRLPHLCFIVKNPSADSLSACKCLHSGFSVFSFNQELYWSRTDQPNLLQKDKIISQSPSFVHFLVKSSSAERTAPSTQTPQWS